jgi:hypothetical protein
MEAAFFGLVNCNLAHFRHKDEVGGEIEPRLPQLARA